MSSHNRIAMFLTVASLALGAPLFASAQDAAPPAGGHCEHGRGGHHGGPGRGNPAERVARMQQHLNLDATQAAAVQQIMTEGRAQHEALRNERLTQDERRARHQAIMTASGQRIRALLRADQQARFDEHVLRMRAHREEGGRGRRGGQGRGAGPNPGSGPTPRQSGI